MVNLGCLLMGLVNEQLNPVPSEKRETHFPMKGQTIYNHKKEARTAGRSDLPWTCFCKETVFNNISSVLVLRTTHLLLAQTTQTVASVLISARSSVRCVNADVDASAAEGICQRSVAIAVTMAASRH